MRFSHRPRRGLRHRLMLAILTCPLVWPGGAAAATADIAQLLEQAREHVAAAAQQTYPTGRIAVSMVPMDPRLRLQPCSDLSFEIPGNRAVGRVAVQARCRAPTSWGLYLTAQVDVVLPVVQATRPVPRDTVLQRSDLALVEHNLAEIRNGYLTDPAAAVGMTLRTSLRADSVIYQRQLAAPRLVIKGETVTVTSSHGQVRVTAQAIALTDGAYGEHVAVRNPRSNRELGGWVTGPGQVTVRP